MNWYTCIIENQNHVTPVQYFHTRAESPAKAEENAFAWEFSGEPKAADPEWRDRVDVPFVFAGRIEPLGTSSPAPEQPAGTEQPGQVKP